MPDPLHTHEYQCRRDSVWRNVHRSPFSGRIARWWGRGDGRLLFRIRQGGILGGAQHGSSSIVCVRRYVFVVEKEEHQLFRRFISVVEREELWGSIAIDVLALQYCLGHA